METTEQIAKGLVALCREMKFDEAMNRYYGQDIVSYEPTELDKPTRGLAAAHEKGTDWYKNFQPHSVTVHGPFLHGDTFIVHFIYDLEIRATGARISAQEAGLYTVKDGKIVEERFFDLKD